MAARGGNRGGGVSNKTLQHTLAGLEVAARGEGAKPSTEAAATNANAATLHKTTESNSGKSKDSTRAALIHPRVTNEGCFNRILLGHNIHKFLVKTSMYMQENINAHCKPSVRLLTAGHRLQRDVTTR